MKDLKGIMKALEKYSWKEEEAPATLHVFSHWVTCYVEAQQVYKKSLWNVDIYALMGAYGYEWVSAEETKKALDWVLGMARKDPEYFEKKEQQFISVVKKIDALFVWVQTQKTLRSDAQANIVNAVHDLGRSMYGYSIITECFDILHDEDYKKMLKNIPEKEIAQVISSMSAPERLMIIDREKRSLLQLAQTLPSESFEGARKALWFRGLQEHTKEFCWMQNGFGRAVNLDEKYFFEQTMELRRNHKDLKAAIEQIDTKQRRLNKERRRLHEEHPLPPHARLLFSMIRRFSFWQDRRKEGVQKMVYCLDRVMQELQKKYGITQQELDYYLVPETLALIKKGERLPAEVLAQRDRAVILSYVEGGKIRKQHFFGEEAQQFYDFLMKDRKKRAAMQQIKGFVASRGNQEKVQGTVRIVMDPAHATFKQGDILVTGMTRPEFVPLMKKAKAIVTNEGGITTHAAIVSRELNIPCIIGTKVATDILKDGDVIELDLKTGVVRKMA